MKKFDKLFENLMHESFVSTSLNYEDYTDRTDDELKAELDDVDKQDPKHFRSDVKKKRQDINDEMKKRKSNNDK
jgi:hypothetical protein